MSSLLDENTLDLVVSRSGTIHVESWFSNGAPVLSVMMGDRIDTPMPGRSGTL